MSSIWLAGCGGPPESDGLGDPGAEETSGGGDAAAEAGGPFTPHVGAWSEEAQAYELLDLEGFLQPSFVGPKLTEEQESAELAVGLEFEPGFQPSVDRVAVDEVPKGLEPFVIEGGKAVLAGLGISPQDAKAVDIVAAQRVVLPGLWSTSLVTAHVAAITEVDVVIDLESLEPGSVIPVEKDDEPVDARKLHWQVDAVHWGTPVASWVQVESGGPCTDQLADAKLGSHHTVFVRAYAGAAPSLCVRVPCEVGVAGQVDADAFGGTEIELGLITQSLEAGSVALLASQMEGDTP